MDTSLTVIIPNYNNVKGLQYLLSYLKEKQYKVAVVDNSKKNLGFAGGVNKGAKEAKTEWLLILNDDIEFEDKITNNKSQITNKYQISNIKYQNTIEKLIKFAQEKKLDAASPILRNPDGKVENYGYKILPIGKVELIKPEQRFWTSQNDVILGRIQRPAETTPESIDGITAACLLVRTDVFKKLGGFDEKFFAYLEDVDFFLRLKKLKDDSGQARMTFGLACDVEVLHNHMTTTRTMGNFKARQDMVNWWRLYFKHPEKFKFDLNFIVERLRNVSGYLKATLNF